MLLNIYYTHIVIYILLLYFYLFIYLFVCLFIYLFYFRISEQIYNNTGCGDQVETKDKNSLLNEPEDTKELGTKSDTKPESIIKDLHVTPEDPRCKSNEPDEVIWRRMVSLEAEAESRNQEIENAQVKY